MSIDMYLEKSQAQAASAKAIAQQEIQAYEELEAALEDFENSGAELKGKTYDSARRYSASVLRPLAMIGKQLAQTVAEAVQRFPEAYMEQVAHESLKESELEMAIAELDMRISNARDAVAGMHLDSRDANEGARLNSYHRMIDAAESSRRVLEDKLEKLRAFNATSPQIFSEIDALKAALDRGIAQAEQSWDSQTGTFKSVGTQWLSGMTAITNQLAKELKLSAEEQQYVENLKAQYGFDDTTARQIIQVRRGLEKKFPDKGQEERDYILNLIMGSFVYQEDSGVKGYVNNQMWFQTAGNLADVTGLPIRNASDLLEWLGMDKKDVKKLRYNIRLQHTMSDGSQMTAEEMKEKDKDAYVQAKKAYKSNYGSAKGFDEFWDKKLQDYTDNDKQTNADFAHQSITTATILRPNYSAADLYGGKDHVEKLAGWLGDTTSAAGASPSIGNDDYRADLDSVNITARMEKEGLSYTEASNQYYADIDSGATTRADEFKTNQNYGEMESAIVGSNTGSIDDESMERLREENPESYNFIMSVKNGDNNLRNYADE